MNRIEDKADHRGGFARCRCAIIFWFTDRYVSLLIMAAILLLVSIFIAGYYIGQQRELCYFTKMLAQKTVHENSK